MNFNEKTPRRAFFKKSLSQTLALGAGMSLTASMLQSFIPDLSDSGSEAFDMQSPMASTEKQFRMGVIGPAHLSHVTSEIAVSKASNKNAKEFAGFELAEAISVTSVLKELGTAVPPMTAKAQATLNKIKTASAGPDFDKAYISAQLENHEFLRDLAQNYLTHTSAKDTGAENQGRHLAMLSLAVFKEHVAITKRILSELNG